MVGREVTTILFRCPIPRIVEVKRNWSAAPALGHEDRSMGLTAETGAQRPSVAGWRLFLPGNTGRSSL